MQALTVLLLLFVVVSPILDWIVALILVRAGLRSPIRALRERALLAFAAAVLTTLFLVNVVNTEAGHVLWATDNSRLVTWGIVIVFGLLPLYWLILYLTGGFRDGE